MVVVVVVYICVWLFSMAVHMYRAADMGVSGFRQVRCMWMCLKAQQPYK